MARRQFGHSGDAVLIAEGNDMTKDDGEDHCSGKEDFSSE
jgi:hypothetical protein